MPMAIRRRPRDRGILLVLGALAAAMPTSARAAGPIAGDAVISARRAHAWEAGGAQWLLVDETVRFTAGGRGFRAKRGAIRITRSGGGHRLAALLDGVRPMPGKRAVEVEGDRIFLTFRVSGAIELRTDWLERKPADHQLLERLRSRTGEAPGARPRPDAPAAAGAAPASVLPPDARLSFEAERVVYRPAEGEEPAAALLFGGIRLMLRGARRTTTLEARRAVVFLEAGAGPEALRAGAGSLESVSGIYLEGHVIAGDGTHTIRAPRVFYDRRERRAMIVDAVVSSWDPESGRPVYLRAERVRQEARRRFSATDARLAPSSFAVPQISIAAGELTVEPPTPAERAEDGANERAGRFTAEDVTLNLGETPILYWPSLAGSASEADSLPVTDLDLDVQESEDNLEVFAETEWDLFALAGVAPPPQTEARARLGWRGDHGASLGGDLVYEGGSISGTLLPSDNGADELPDRRDIDRDGDTRGRAQWRHRAALGEDWGTTLEAAYVSDATFLEEFRGDAAESARADRTRARLFHRSGGGLFAVTASHDVNDLLPQLTTLQSPGHVVDRAPEVTYRQAGLGLFGGRLVWRSENRLGRVRIVPGEDRPAARGFNDRQSAALFGIPDADTPFDEARSAAGAPLGFVGRADTRQELALPFDVGPIRATAYTTGRITAYDQSFDELRGEEDSVRLWGGAGLRATGTWHGVYESAWSRLLNVYHLRHLIEPRAHLFVSGATLDSRDLPLIDPEVERIAEGWTTAWGLRQTFQTKRGPPGDRRSVDWLILDSEVVFREDAETADVPLARFFDHRPELSRGGDHWRYAGRWRLTESAAATGEMTLSLDAERVQRWRAGFTLDHNPRLGSWLEYVDTAAFDTATLAAGFDYRLTDKYRLGFSNAVDLARGELRTLDLELTRRFPQWRLALDLSLDELGETQSLTINIEPGRGREQNPLDRLR